MNQYNQILTTQLPMQQHSQKLNYKTPPKKNLKKQVQSNIPQIQRENQSKSKPKCQNQQKKPSQNVLRESNNQSKNTQEVDSQKQTLDYMQTTDYQPESPHKLQITPQENQIQNQKQKSNYNSQNMKQKNYKQRSQSPYNQPQTGYEDKLEQFQQKMNQDHLKAALRALNEKLKFYENIEQEKDIVANQLNQSELARADLEQNIKETSERVNEEKDKNKKYQQILIQENENLSKQILQITDMFSKKVQEFDKLKEDKYNLEMEKNQIEIERQDLIDYQEKFERQFDERNQLQERFNQLEDVFSLKQDEFKQRIQGINQEKLEIANKNRELQQIIASLREQLEDQQYNSEQQLIQLSNKDVEIEQLQQKMIELESAKQQNMNLQKELLKMKEEKECLTDQIHHFNEQNMQIQDKLRGECERLSEERNNLNEELNDLFQEKSEKDIIIKTLTSENLELNNRIIAIEQLLCYKVDFDQKLEEMTKSYQQLEKIKDKYKVDLEICTNYLLEVEEKCQEAQRTSLELLQQLKQKEAIIQQLQNGGRVEVYQAVQNDPIDRKLADYINQAPVEVRNKLIYFEREQEGIYKYAGKKRVFMKIEGDQIIIRVGGGYLTIEEFIDQYCFAQQEECCTQGLCNGIEHKKKLFGLIYGGQCQGSKENFQTFYFTQKTLTEDCKQVKDKDTASEDEYEEEECQDVVGDLKNISSDYIAQKFQNEFE